MPGYISRESWSRSEQPSMLYDTVRNPSAPYTPPKTSTFLASGQDSIESVQQRLNRELLERLHSKGPRLPHDTFVAVVHAGKYLFLAIMLPPYLCFYGLPRWFLVNLMPQLAEVAKQATLQVGWYIFEFSKRVTDLMRGMMDQMIGFSLKVFRDRGRHVWERIANASAALMKNLQAGREVVAEVLGRLAKPLGELGTRLRNGTKQAGEQIGAFGKKATEPFKEMLKATAAKLNGFYNSVMTLVQPMVEAYAQASKQVEAARQAIVKAVRSVTDPVAKAVASTFESIYEQASGSAAVLFHPIVERATEAYSAVTHFAKAARKKVEEVAKEAVEGVKHALRPAFNAVADQVRAAWAFVPWMANRASEQASRLVPARVRRPSDASKEKKGKLRQLASGAGRGVKEMTALVGKGSFAVAKEGKKLFAILFEVLRWAFSQLRFLPKYIGKALAMVMRASGNILKALGRGIQIFIAVIWALCLYNSYLVKQTTNSLLPKGK